MVKIGGTKLSQGKIAVVTGASRLKGIGAAVCRELAAARHDILFTYWMDYDREMPWGVAAEEPILLREELKGKGVRAVCMEADLSNPDVPGGSWKQ